MKEPRHVESREGLGDNFEVFAQEMALHVPIYIKGSGRGGAVGGSKPSCCFFRQKLIMACFPFEKSLDIFSHCSRGILFMIKNCPKTTKIAVTLPL